MVKRELGETRGNQNAFSKNSDKIHISAKIKFKMESEIIVECLTLKSNESLFLRKITERPIS